MKNPYQPQKFEKKWQEYWERNKTYKSKNISGFKNKEKQYVLAMFPYPSGAGLHVGHVRNYTGTDVLARFFRMSGRVVLHPMGWDAFGLPAENAAVKAKVNPMDMVPGHIETFKKQMKSLGFSYDWDREFATIDPKYYRWTQWLFIQFFKMGLLYKRNAPINYCPKCKTGLAEEEVLADGTHERCGHKIVKKDLPQWIFRITEYAERLLSELEGLDWPEGILAMQRNWIGKKEGINIDYKIVDGEVRHRDLLSTSPPKGGSPKSLTKNQVSSLPAIDTITCFTTRPDTNFGATFIVVAPEHPFVKKIIGGELKSKEADVKKIREYVEKAASKSEMERQAEGRKKTGVFTGFYAVNNLNGRKMPIWVSDFALMNFGTGAVVGVPGHDVRDFEFAHEFGIEVIRVVKGKDGDLSSITKVEQVQEEEGTMINSGFLDGMDIHKATVKVMDWFEEKGYGKRVVSYHLRDWIFSRQRYWGEPIPMVYCEKCAKEGKSYFDTEEGKKFVDENSKIIGGRVDEVREGLKGWFPLSEKDLPLELPYLKSYEPPESGESPLSQVDSFVKAKCPNCGSEAKRETDTMPNWAGSCWYFLAFPFWNKDVDSARPIFITRESHPASRGPLESEKTIHASLSKRVSSSPYMSMKDEWLANRNLSEGWTPVDWYLGGAEHAVLHLLYSRFWVKVLYDMKFLDFKEPFLRLKNQGMVLAEDHRKMSKSFGNVINPDDVIKEYGADALRVYEMFMAPFNAEIPWSTKALQGSFRFVKRVWEIFDGYRSKESTAEVKEDKKLVSKLNKIVKKITSDIPQIKFNTPIASMMEFMNDWEASNRRGDVQSLSVESAKKFLKVLAPFAPFIAEEVWQEVFKEKESIHLSSWPEVGSISADEEVSIPVQVNGKYRVTLTIPFEKVNDKDEIEKLALADERVKRYIEGKKHKTVYIKSKIINFVVLKD